MRLKGFTILELLIVVIIIGILAGTALPQYVSTLEKARSAEALSNMGALRSSMDRYWYDHVAFLGDGDSYLPATVSTLDIDSPNLVGNRFYNYTITDTSISTSRQYIIKAERLNDPEKNYWVKWIQTDSLHGQLYRSKALGGPES